MPESQYATKCVSHMLYQLRGKGGFPYLLKIQSGQIEHLSVNAVVYRMLYHKREVPELVEMINNFYKVQKEE